LRKPDELKELSAWPEDLVSWVRADGNFEQVLYEQWSPPTRLMLEAICGLAVVHRGHFAAQIDQICDSLR
jgi:hypothetical protein